MNFAFLFSIVTLLLSAEADTWKNITQESDGISGNEIQFISEDSDGVIWIGTRSGLTSNNGKEFKKELERGEIWSVLRMGKDTYWIGTGNGAIYRKAGKDELTLKGSTVAPIILFDKSVVWAISKDRRTEQNALVQNDGSGWKPVDKFKKERLVDLFRGSDGKAWIVLDGNGAYAVDPAKSIDSAVHHLEGSNVTTLFEDSKKRIWAGLWEGGVLVLEDGKWQRHLKKEKSFIFGIREDNNGDIWVATNQNGLWRTKGDKWTNDLSEEGGINLMSKTSDGRIWISTQSQGGLRYWDGKKWVVSLDSPLPIRCLHESRDKKVWAGGVLDGVHVKQ